MFNAAKGCVLAAVVVSEQYSTRSKWPMLELAAIVQAPGCQDSSPVSKSVMQRVKEPEAKCGMGGPNQMTEFVRTTGRLLFGVLMDWMAWSMWRWMAKLLRKEIVTTICDLMQRRSQDAVRAYLAFMCMNLSSIFSKVLVIWNVLKKVEASACTYDLVKHWSLALVSYHCRDVRLSSWRGQVILQMHVSTDTILANWTQFTDQSDTHSHTNHQQVHVELFSYNGLISPTLLRALIWLF